MGDTIALLDDEPERIALMEPLLRERFSQCGVSTFDNGPDMVLEEAGWQCRRVIPDSQLSWIAKWWFPVVEDTLGR